MEDDYCIPGSLISCLDNLFDRCKCGAHPFFGILRGNAIDGNAIIVSCPFCNRFESMNFSDDDDLDFVTLASVWNHFDVKEVVKDGE